MGLAAPNGTGSARRWSPLAPSGDPLLDAVDLRGAHDFRHTSATWLEDAGIPARVIDELMGHEASTRGAQHLGSTMGAHYRHTTPEMATRVVMAIQDRLAVAISVAEQVVEAQPTRCHVTCSDDYEPRFLANLWQMAVGSAPGMQEAGCWTRPVLLV
jgi:Phage integrase family